MLKSPRLHRYSSIYTSGAVLQQKNDCMFGDGVVPTFTVYIVYFAFMTPDSLKCNLWLQKFE